MTRPSARAGYAASTEADEEVRGHLDAIESLAVQVRTRLFPHLVASSDPLESLMLKLGYDVGTTDDEFKSSIAGKTTLGCAGRGLGPKECRSLVDLFKSIGGAVNMEALDLSSNRVGNIGIIALAEVIESDALSGLDRLILADTGMGSKGVGALTDALGRCSSLRLTKLDLGGNKIFASGGMMIADLAAEKSPEALASLENLSLGGCAMGDEATLALLRALRKSCPYIRTIDLTGNLLTCSGHEAKNAGVDGSWPLQAIILREAAVPELVASWLFADCTYAPNPKFFTSHEHLDYRWAPEGAAMKNVKMDAGTQSAVHEVIRAKIRWAKVDGKREWISAVGPSTEGERNFALAWEKFEENLAVQAPAASWLVL